LPETGWVAMMTQMKGFNSIDGMKLAAFCLRQKHSMFLQGSQILTRQQLCSWPKQGQQA